MPVFGYRCEGCGARTDHVVLPGEDPPSRCADCGGTLKRTWSARLHVSLEGWGFSKTDSLISDTRGKDFKALKERAQRIVEE